MQLPRLTTLLALALTTSIHAASPSFEAGATYVKVSGVRSYESPYLKTNKTSSIAAPYLHASLPLGDSWQIGISYSYYATLKGEGTAPVPDAFVTIPGYSVGSVMTTVSGYLDTSTSSLSNYATYTPTTTGYLFTSSEKIHDFSADLRYRLDVAKDYSLEFGPVLSLFVSKATVAEKSYSGSEIRLGAVARLTYDVNENWSVSGNYRLIKPTGRTLQSLSLGLALKL